MTRRIVVVDNHDSFVFTLVDYLRLLGADIDLVEADEVSDPAAVVRGAVGVMISPGPRAPAEAGRSADVVCAADAAGVSVLGVCLGHQVIAEVYGARVATAPELMHGMVSDITHDGTGLFGGLPSPLRVGRYHSLAIVPETLTRDLVPTAVTPDGTVMAVRHATRPVLGVQFHPESVLTEGGHRLLANWLATCGFPDAVAASRGLTPLG